MPWHNFRYETKEERRKRLVRERARRRRRRKELTDPFNPMTYLKMGRRRARKELRKLTGPARRRIKRDIRRQQYSMRKRMFGACPNCGRAAGPGHRCRMKFTAKNASNLRSRLERQEMPNQPGRNRDIRREQAGRVVSARGAALWRANRNS